MNMPKKVSLAIALLLACFPGRAFSVETELKVVPTIADLKQTDITSSTSYPDNTVIKILGYWAPNDGGGGEFRLQRLGTGTLASDNTGTIIAPDDITSTTSVDESTLGRWIRICDPGVVNVLWFGARPDANLSSSATHYDSLASIRKAFESLPKINSANDESGEPGHTGVLYFPKIAYPSLNGTNEANYNRWRTTYYVSDTLVVSQRITIRGDGFSNSAIRFLNGVAESSSTEKFVLYFARGGDSGPAGNTTFECGVERISIMGSPDGLDAGSSGIFMDPAQMSFIRDAEITYVGLRGIVGAPYTIENVSLGARRGPGLDINNSQPMLLGQSIGGADTKVHVTNLFVGNVDETLLAKDPATSDYYPAIRLKNCNMFVCSDVRAERCLKLLEASSCDSLVVSNVYIYDFPPSGATPPFPPSGASSTTAISLDRVSRAHFTSLRLQPYTVGLVDYIPTGWSGGGTRSYASTITSWHRGINGGAISYDDTSVGSKIDKLDVTGNIQAGSNISATNNVTGNNVYATNNVSSNALYTGNANVTNVYATGNLSAGSNVFGSNVYAMNNMSSTAVYTGTVNSANVYASGNLSAGTNVSGSNVYATNNMSADAIFVSRVTTTGAATMANSVKTGTLIAGSGSFSGSMTAASISTSGAISTSSTISAGSLSTGSLTATGTVSAPAVTVNGRSAVGSDLNTIIYQPTSLYSVTLDTTTYQVPAGGRIDVPLTVSGASLQLGDAVIASVADSSASVTAPAYAGPLPAA